MKAVEREGPQGITRPLVAFDLETTGTRPEGDAIIEFGAARRRNGRLETFQTFVNPHRPIPWFIRNLTGIREKDVADAPDLEEAFRRFLAFAEGGLLVAHNAPFDRGFVEGQGFALPGPVVDSLFFSHLVMPREESHGLEAHAERRGVTLRHHRASDDATLTLELMESFLQAVQAMDPGLRRQLALLAAPSEDPELNLLARFTGPALQASVWTGPPPAPSIPPRRAIPSPTLDVLTERLGLEPRPGQERLFSLARDTFEEGGVAVVEAGTGTGKSLAYLAAALHAVGKEGRAVVATHTINLQDQLLTKDIPQMEEVTGPIGAVLLKGQANYLCLYRWQADRERVERDGTATERKAHALLLTWLSETATGDRQEISVGSDTWMRVNVQSETCIRERCPFFEACFFYRRRRAADESPILVVNHALLLADALSGGMVLPEAEVLIVDEAHQLETQALEQLGKSGYEADLRADLEGAQATGVHKLEEDVPRATEALSRLCRAVEGTVGMRRRRRLPDPEGLDRLIGEARNAVLALRDVEQGLRSASEGAETNASRSGFLSGLADRLALGAAAIASAFYGDDDVRWVECGHRPGHVRFRASPLEVGPALREILFGAHRSALLTSATLAVGDDFGHTLRSLGLEDVPKVTTDVVAAPFAYRDQALLGAVTDLPDPREDGYDEAAERFLLDLLPLSPGGSLVLFTSHEQLRKLARNLQGPLGARGVTVLAQGADGSRKGLLDRLRKGERVAVFGAQSFWEGVDVQGPALSLVAVMRLPFTPPDHPVRQSRAERVEADGGSAFFELSLPEAVLRFKQGFGRLVRSSLDQGAVVVLDRRLATSRYGQVFLEAMPGPSLAVGPHDEVLEAVRKWMPPPSTIEENERS